MQLHHAHNCIFQTSMRKARNVENKALVCRGTMHELSVQAHELSIGHCAQAHELLIMAATTAYVDDVILRVSTQGIHIASPNGDDNNKGNDNNRCQRQGLVRERTAFLYRVTQQQQRQQLLATTNDDVR
jgi:hypothetical protein